MTNTIVNPAAGLAHAVESDGLKLFVWEKRPDKLEAVGNHVVLLVHGATYSGATDFDVQVPAGDASFMEYLVARGMDVFTFDVRGYGRSEEPDDAASVTTEAAVNDISAVVEFICANRAVDTVDLLGWSWGGVSTALYTSRHPERVRRLVMYAGGASQGAATGAPAAPVEPWVVSSRQSIMDRIEQDAVVEDAQEAFIKAALLWDARSPASGRRLPGPGGRPLRAEPERIGVPTLVIYGARDAGYRAEEVANFVARLDSSDKGLVVVPDAGHFLLIQKPRLRLFSAAALWFSY